VDPDQAFWFVILASPYYQNILAIYSVYNHFGDVRERKKPWILVESGEFILVNIPRKKRALV
jgi:hypothetical protein